MDPRADDALLGALPDLVMVVDADLVLRRTTDAWEALLGWLTTPRIGHTLTDLVHPDDIAVLSAAATAVTSRHTGAPVEIRLRTAEGSWRPFEVVARNAEGVDGVDGVVLAARDLRARRTPDGAEVRLQRAVHLSPSMTLLLDRDGTVIAASAAVTRLLGRDLTDVVGLPLAACCEPDSVAELAAALHACTQQGVSLTCEVQMRNVADDGIERDPLAVRLDMVDRLDDPTVGAIVVSGHDVSDLHRAQRTDGSGDGTEDRELALPMRGVLGIKAGEARSLARDECGEMRIEVEHRALDHRFALPHGFAIEQETLPKPRRGIDDEIRLSNKTDDVVFAHMLGQCHNFDMRIEFSQALSRGINSQRAEPWCRHQQLTIEIAGLDLAAMREHEFPDARCGQIRRDRPADPADPRNQNAGRLELLLADLTQVRQPHLPLVPSTFDSGQ